LGVLLGDWPDRVVIDMLSGLLEDILLLEGGLEAGRERGQERVNIGSQIGGKTVA
jgi:hypothetical protein